MKTQINKSEIFKAAHKLVKENKVNNFSNALKVTWMKAKYSVTNVYVIGNKIFPVLNNGVLIFLKQFDYQIGKTVLFNSDVLMSVINSGIKRPDELMEGYKNQYDLIYN